jgi:hypothetical protein
VPTSTDELWAKMESSTEEQLTNIKERKRLKELERARTEAQADAARDQVREATTLLMEMGCTTIEEAKTRMRELQRDIDEQIEEIRKSL